MKKRLPFFESIAIIVGTIVGAGVLGLPFVFAQAGFLTGVFALLVLGSILIVVRLMLGEVTLRTEKSHQLTGYTARYVGRWAKYIQSFVLIIGLFGTLLAYMVAQGDILSSLFGGTSMTWSLIFYLSFSFLVIQGLDVIKRSELILTVVIFFVVVVIAGFSAPSVSFEALGSFDVYNFFVPYGVILFACSGMISVPEVRKILRISKQERIMKKAIIWGGIIPVALYLVFATLVVGVTGSATTEVATVGLGEVLGPRVLILGNIFGFFAISTSFLTLAIGLNSIFRFDYSIPRPLASALVVSVPLIAFALGMRDFITTLAIVGSMSVGVNGIFAVWSFWKARKLGDREPEYSMPVNWSILATIILVPIFIFGLIFVFV